MTDYSAPSRVGKQGGFTLVELLITASLLALASLAIIALYRSGVFAFFSYSARQERLDKCESALRQLTDEIENAEEVVFVEPYRLRLKQPAREENTYASPDELVIWEWREAEQTLYRIRGWDVKPVTADISRMEFVKSEDGRIIWLDFKPGNEPLLTTAVRIDNTERHLDTD